MWVRLHHRMRWTEVDPPPHPQVQQVKMLFPPPPHMTSPEERANVTQATHNRTQHNDLARGGLGVSFQLIGTLFRLKCKKFLLVLLPNSRPVQLLVRPQTMTEQLSLDSKKV